MNAVQPETIIALEGQEVVAQRADAPSERPATPSRPHRRTELIAGAILAVLCLCAGASAALFASISSEKGPLEASIGVFMQALSYDDYDGAYAQFSARGQQSITAAEFEEYFSRRATKALAAGFRAADIENINMNWTANADPTAPQGQVAEVSGSLSYEDGYTGAFEAILEREGSEWRIYGINITVPPQKVEAYLKD